MIRLQMKNCYTILAEKYKNISYYLIGKILSSGKINKYEDLTGEEILPSHRKFSL